MGDDWFGHRDPLTGESRGDRDEYTSWDYALQNAFQTIEDYTDSRSGLLMWEIEDERAVVDAVRRINKFEQAVALTTAGTEKKPYKPRPGEYFVPKMWSRESDENGDDVYQTMREWIEQQIED